MQPWICASVEADGTAGDVFCGRTECSSRGKASVVGRNCSVDLKERETERKRSSITLSGQLAS